MKIQMQASDSAKQMRTFFLGLLSRSDIVAIRLWKMNWLTVSEKQILHLNYWNGMVP